MKAYPVDVGGKLASEDEAVNALLQARDVHDLHKIAFHCAQLLGVTQPLVLGVLSLHTHTLMQIEGIEVTHGYEDEQYCGMLLRCKAHNTTGFATL